MTDTTQQALRAIYQHRARLARSTLHRRMRRRTFRRFTVNVVADVLAGDTPIRVHTANLSAGGAYLTGAAELPPQSEVLFRVQGQREYRFPAQVIRFKRNPKTGWEFALAFVGAPLELRPRASYADDES